MSQDAVLLVGHGTVTDLNDLPEFLRRIRRGRPAGAELETEMRRRYVAIGGSPLLEWTEKQAHALESKLGVPVTIGMRMWRPTIEEALAKLEKAGVRRIVVLPLAPFSVHVYQDAVAQAATAAGNPSTLLPVPPWGQDKTLVAAHAARTQPFLGEGAEDATEVLLSAHSLPRAVVEAGDSYQAEIEACARALFERLGRTGAVVYQSQGADGGDWLGPDLPTAFETARRAGKRRVVVVPIGFLSDHVETLYDLDIEARSVAEKLGLAFTRVPALNDDAGLIQAMAEVATRALSGSDRG